MSSGREMIFPSPVRSRPMKRQHPTVPSGISGTFEDKTNDFLCPICFDVLEEAHITRCGHTFCFRCISKALEVNHRCPKCSFALAGIEHTFPNFLLNELIAKYKSRLKAAEELGLTLDYPFDRGSSSQSNSDGLKDFVASESQNLSLPDVNVMLEVLQQRKQRLEAESCATQNKLLYEFLKNLLRLKERQLCDITKEVSIIKKDIEEVEEILRNSDSDSSSSSFEKTSEDPVSKKEAVVPDRKESNRTESFNSIHKSTEITQSSFSLRNQIIQAHFDDFVKCYFACRAKEITFGKSNDKCSSSSDTSVSNITGLDTFRDNLIKFSRYSKLRPLATLSYSNDIFNNSTIVSSIEFDKDNEFFAIAGVTKRIKVYEYAQVIQDTVDVHYPCTEMVSSSKISCISWNSYHKGVLASSDYEGTVTIWDVSTSQRTKTFQEHEKRCWSVDFNNVDTRLIASGSDDARVKLWSLNEEHSIASLEAKANVCCVKFNPKSSCHLAFGSADHCVHYYDLRNMKHALAVFKGHRKAVSYVKFLSREDIVSASTDSQLKLWNINASHCLRSYVGHINEKNFVGLATDGDYIACGSENNSLYIYYKGLCKKLLHYKFDGLCSVLEKEEKDDDVNEFVSAVCWKQLSNVVIAANSQGTIKILELI
ncbi:E3 ubiquitin-protein ligase COP1-like isoform X1 [Planococcus citri]|uniref:E3 ubiquitin-protein ligase COP1-like isoform X1 n=1 Tax=Planococcus citri TaxID=170843 RepID=UPI0031F79996